MATLRNLKIKTGTCKRLVKELHSYEEEVEREASKTADMKEKGADPYDLKQQVRQTKIILQNAFLENPIAYLTEGIGIYSYSNIFL